MVIGAGLSPALMPERPEVQHAQEISSDSNTDCLEFSSGGSLRSNLGYHPVEGRRPWLGGALSECSSACSSMCSSASTIMSSLVSAMPLACGAAPYAGANHHDTSSFVSAQYQARGSSNAFREGAGAGITPGAHLAHAGDPHSLAQVETAAPHRIATAQARSAGSQLDGSTDLSHRLLLEAYRISQLAAGADAGLPPRDARLTKARREETMPQPNRSRAGTTVSPLLPPVPRTKRPMFEDSVEEFSLGHGYPSLMTSDLKKKTRKS